MPRAFLRAVVQFLFSVFTRLEVRGLDNIPESGPAILATNHISIIDAPLVFILVERSDVTALVADKYLKKPFFRWLINAVHGIWINRESADLNALRQAVDHLQRGGLLGIAPEGTRSHTAALSYAKTGAAYLAEKAAQAIGGPVPIVPFAIAGTDKAFHELARLKRGHIRVFVGKPFVLPALAKQGRSEALQANTDEIMCRIASLLPESYRGAYEGHSRVLQLLESGSDSRSN